MQDSTIYIFVTIVLLTYSVYLVSTRSLYTWYAPALLWYIWHFRELIKAIHDEYHRSAVRTVGKPVQVEILPGIGGANVCMKYAYQTADEEVIIKDRIPLDRMDAERAQKKLPFTVLLLPDKPHSGIPDFMLMYYVDNFTDVFFHNIDAIMVLGALPVGCILAPLLYMDHSILVAVITSLAIHAVVGYLWAYSMYQSSLDLVPGRVWRISGSRAKNMHPDDEDDGGMELQPLQGILDEDGLDAAAALTPSSSGVVKRVRGLSVVSVEEDM